MLQERETFGLSSYCHNRTGLIKVDAGNDSVVYRKGNEAVKIYERLELEIGHEFSILQKYRDLTNLASLLSEKEDWTITVGDLGKFKLRINPYSSIEKCEEHDICVGTAPFVSGISLVNKKTGFNPDIRFKEGSLFLQRRLNCSGINLAPINLKYVNGVIVVTDLCSHLVRL